MGLGLSHSWEGFLGNLVTLRRSSALIPQYIAVRAGLRKSLDDWVPLGSLDPFARVLANEGLVFRIDCVFTPLAAGQSAAGMQYAPTTRATGTPWREGTTQRQYTTDSVHLVIAATSEHAEETLHNAWYPVVVHDRVLRKPLKDHQWLGETFGYPDCCVTAFMRDNNWNRTNMYAEAARRSHEFAWQTNCLPKLGPWTTVFHMPCSFDCRPTISYTDSLLKEISAYDLEYGRKIQFAMRQPVLTLSERSGVALHNSHSITRQTASYSGVTDWYTESPYRQSFENHRFQTLQSGDRISVIDGCVVVQSGGALRGVIEPIWDTEVVEIPEILVFE